MSPIQQMLLGVGAVASKTYVDDVFSTYLWAGSGSARSINNGINLSESGGMVWIKGRSFNYDHIINDTIRGAGKRLKSNASSGEATSTDWLSAFNSNGFSLGTDNDVNNSGQTYSSWTFRKAPGFFDVVTYTGNGNSRTIAHSLGSVPGCIMIKCTSKAQDWVVYHRGSNASPEDYVLRLNDTNAAFSAAAFNNTLPTSTNFSLGTAGSINGNGETYVAYVFAGGESTAATARSVEFDPAYPGDYLSLSGSSDFAYGTGDFTWEAFVRFEVNDTGYIINHGSNHYGGIYISDTTVTYKNSNGSNASIVKAYRNSWNHIAVSRSSGTTRVFVNGTLGKTKTSDTMNYSNSSAVTIGASETGSFLFAGKISNVRLVKGTALYTSSFRPPTEPLTNVTNTKLLCCNNSSATGSTVTPGTITANGNATASTDSPFDDPAAFKYGESQEGIIKCGSYKGNGSSSGPEIYLGWEPQWVLLKKTSGTGSWKLFDSMRGVVKGGADSGTQPDLQDEDFTSSDRIDFNAKGFTIPTASVAYNGNGDEYIYTAIRRIDGYVGKPIELGTDVFAMDTGNNSSTIPAMDTGFPVDFGLAKKPATTDNWRTGARLTGTKALYTNTTDGESNHVNQVWDSNVGFWKSINSTFQAWAWKRHAGFEVVTYKGTGVAGFEIPHNLNGVPEMIITKNREIGNQYARWGVGHIGLDGGNAPWTHNIQLQSNSAQGDWDGMWNDTAPTATHFTVGQGSSSSNGTNQEMIGYLFKSVAGVCKVGSYTGNGTSTGPVITLGFEPRFLILKNADSNGNGWAVFDTLRGLGTSAQSRIWLDWNEQENAGGSDANYVTTTSTSFQPVQNNTEINENGSTIIYYAHA